jgi:DNA-binding beta-propeller fold protein YncE
MPWDVSCYYKDGTCWVADTGNGRVVKLAQDGSKMFERGAPGATSVAVDERNGDCWVAASTKLIKYSADGAKKKEVGGLTGANGVDVNPSDGSVVVADLKRVLKFDANGNKKWETGGFNTALRVAVNKDDGSVWVSDAQAKKVAKLSSGGKKLLVLASGFSFPMGLDVRYENP